MGTRCDFYVGRGAEAEWLGSYPFDGYPEGVAFEVLSATTEEGYRAAVAAFLANDRATLPEQGWPWPWSDSSTTDYAYALDDGKVWASRYGHAWVDPLDPPLNEDEEWDDGEAKSAVFPDMTERQQVTFGDRSGLIVFGA